MPVRLDLKCSAAVLAAGAICACDSTVGLDTQRKYFDDVLVSGMCKSTADYSHFDVAMQILSKDPVKGTISVLPNDRISGEPRTVEQVLSTQDFKFSLPQDHNGVDGAQFQGFVENSSQPGPRTGVSLLPTDLRFDWTGGETRRSDDQLVVFLVDHSGSLHGQPDPSKPPEPTKASDLNDEHVTFLKHIVNLPSIPTSTYFSLVWFDGRQPSITKEFATPTRNHDVMVCPSGADQLAVDCRADEKMDGLTHVERGETGATPLIDALDQTYKVVINGDKTRALNPIVVLFTDGVETGDSSPSHVTMTDVMNEYTNHTYGGEVHPVPIIVLHLQAAASSGYPRGRDDSLYSLACATGGEYVFLEHPEDFQNNDLEPLISTRLFGTWHLTVSSTDVSGLDQGPYLLSSSVTLTLGETTKSAALEKPKDPTAKDSRLWFVKF